MRTYLHVGESGLIQFRFDRKDNYMLKLHTEMCQSSNKHSKKITECGVH